MREKQEQSLESQLKMARPRRYEVKRVPLTPEEKEFLGEIMDKAVAAEKAGELQEALNLYTDYKNELLKIKETKEKEKRSKEEIKKIQKELIEWAGSFNTEPEKWINKNFDLKNMPDIICYADIDLDNTQANHLPDNLIVHGLLSIQNTPILKLPHNLCVEGDFNISNTKLTDLPDDLIVNGILEIDAFALKKIKDKAHELKRAGQVIKINEIL